MKKTLLLIMILLVSCESTNKNKKLEIASSVLVEKSELYDLYAGPLNKYGPGVQVYSVFGENTGCKIKVVENNTNGNIFLQVRYNKDNQTLNWHSYNQGDFIKAQVVYCRATSTSTGGNIKIKIN